MLPPAPPDFRRTPGVPRVARGLRGGESGPTRFAWSEVPCPHPPHFYDGPLYRAPYAPSRNEELLAPSHIRGMPSALVAAVGRHLDPARTHHPQDTFHIGAKLLGLRSGLLARFQHLDMDVEDYREGSRLGSPNASSSPPTSDDQTATPPPNSPPGDASGGLL
eukprot:Selendium_serpulae@DN11538_c0_g1_i1.p1